MENSFVYYIIIPVVNTFILFITSLILNVFKGEARKSPKDLLRASLYVAIGLALSPIVSLIGNVLSFIPLLGLFIYGFTFIYPLAVIGIGFQLNDWRDCIFMGAIYMIMLLWADGMIVNALLGYPGLTTTLTFYSTNIGE